MTFIVILVYAPERYLLRITTAPKCNFHKRTYRGYCERRVRRLAVRADDDAGQPISVIVVRVRVRASVCAHGDECRST